MVKVLVNGQYIARHYVGALSLAMSIGLCIPNDDDLMTMIGLWAKSRTQWKGQIYVGFGPRCEVIP